VNINEIFWGLKNAKLEGENIGAAVNADLKRRVRSVNGVTVHRAVAQNDIRQASKLVVLYDHKTRLFAENTETAEGKQKAHEKRSLRSYLKLPTL